MPASSSPVRVLIAGAGAFGCEHLRRLVGRADANVVGAADPDPAALERASSVYGVANCRTDPLAMIANTEADAIIVATPAAAHVDTCVSALGANLCVLLEKPIAPSQETAAPLIAAERRSTAFVLPGHVLRFSKDHQRLVEIVRSGQIGEVIYVNSRRYRDDGHVIRYPDVDPVLTTLVHDIDLAQWVTDSRFPSALAHRSGAPGFRSMTAVRAITATGVVCDLRTAWTFADGDLPPDRWEVVGDRGSVELTVGQSLQVHRDGRRVDVPLAPGDDPLRNEHDHFLACIRDRTREPALRLRDALAGLELADAAIESLRTGLEVVATRGRDQANEDVRIK